MKTMLRRFRYVNLLRPTGGSDGERQRRGWSKIMALCKAPKSRSQAYRLTDQKWCQGMCDNSWRPSLIDATLIWMSQITPPIRARSKQIHQLRARDSCKFMQIMGKRPLFTPRFYSALRLRKAVNLWKFGHFVCRSTLHWLVQFSSSTFVSSSREFGGATVCVESLGAIPEAMVHLWSTLHNQLLVVSLECQWERNILFDLAMINLTGQLKKTLSTIKSWHSWAHHIGGWDHMHSNDWHNQIPLFDWLVLCKYVECGERYMPSSSWWTWQITLLVISNWLRQLSRGEGHALWQSKKLRHSSKAVSASIGMGEDDSLHWDPQWINVIFHFAWFTFMCIETL